MQNNFEKVQSNVVRAISELSTEGIIGVIYFYKKGECSCCFGPKGDNVFFVVDGNRAGNQGSYDEEIWDEWKICFEQNKDKAGRVAKVLRKHLRSSGYRLDWDGSLSSAMFITKQ